MSLHGSLAQLVEPRTLNPLVEGSNPSRPTTLQFLCIKQTTKWKTGCIFIII